MPSPRWLPFLAVAALGACGSKVTSTIDTDLQAKVNTLQDCFPNLYGWMQGLLEIADTWKLNHTGGVPDPTGLSWSLGSGGRIDATLTRGASTFAMQIRFYSPTGVEQDLGSAMTGATTLSDAIDAAATELRNTFGNSGNFLLGQWSISGGGIAASGEGLVGILGGTSHNQLDELRTIAVTVTAPNGVPAVDPSTITDSGPPVCSLTFTAASLVIDEDMDQQYPSGDIAVTVTGPEATVDATITFDKTSTAQIAIQGVNGTFAFDVVARTITFTP